MQLWRTNICKITVLLLVLSGYGLHTALPFGAERHSDAFTRWLESVVKEEHKSDVRQQLKDLRSHSGELAPLIQKASKIVHQNNEDFQLPLTQQTNSRTDVYHLLVKEWNQHTTDASMQPLTLPLHDGKNLTLYPRITPAFSVLEKLQSWNSTLLSQSFTLVRVLSNPFRIDVIPLIGGTAIGAP